MTTNELKLKQSLAETIEKWLNDSCESDEYGETGIIIHDEMSSNMGEAAWNVFYASYKSQQYRKNGGYDD